MKILLADRQDITRAGLSYVIEKMEGLESKYVEDKAELMLALKENEDTVVILDYTNFDINDAAELLILNATNAAKLAMTTAMRSSCAERSMANDRPCKV